MPSAFDHPAYTMDRALACDATGWGGNHTCHCVYRKTVCDGTDHLCMCGSTWRTATGAYTRCSCPHHDKENSMPAVPLRIHLESKVGPLTAEITISSTVPDGTAVVAAEHLVARAAGVMRSLLVTDEKLRTDTTYPEGDFS